MNLPDYMYHLSDDQIMLLRVLLDFRDVIQVAIEAAQNGDLSELDYTPEEFADELSFAFSTGFDEIAIDEIVDALKDKKLTYEKFVTVLMREDNIVTFLEKGYLDENLKLTQKAYDCIDHEEELEFDMLINE